MKHSTKWRTLSHMTRKSRNKGVWHKVIGSKKWPQNSKQNGPQHVVRVPRWPPARSKTMGGLLRGGRGVCCWRGGGGYCWRREGEGVVAKGRGRLLLKTWIWGGQPPSSFFIFKVASSQGQTPSKNNMETNKKNTRRKTIFPPPPLKNHPPPL